MTGPDLDHAYVADLSMRILLLIGEHMASGEPSRKKVFEVLNAMAVATATILASTEGDIDDARSWFDGAIDLTVVDLRNAGWREKK
jgi:hypothetical protein